MSPHKTITIMHDTPGQGEGQLEDTEEGMVVMDVYSA